MELIIGLIIMVAAAVGAGCVVSPRFRTLVKGAGGLFLEDMAKTPKGAKIAYTQAISEAQEKYDKSCIVLSNLVGKATELHCDLNQTTDNLEKVERDCDKLAQRQDEGGLILKVQQRQALVDKRVMLSESLMQLEPRVEEAKQINTQLQTMLGKLQSEKETTLEEMELSQQMTAVYSQLDALRADTGTQKLLASAREGAKEAKRQAVGAQTVHNNKLETKVGNLDRQLAMEEHNDYARQLLDKYKNKSDVEVK